MTSTVPRPKRKDPVPANESVPFSIRLPGALYNELNALSERERRTLNAQIQYMLERQLKVKRAD